MQILLHLIHAITEEGAHLVLHRRYHSEKTPYHTGRIVRKGTPLEGTSWTFAKAVMAVILRHATDAQGRPLSQNYISKTLGVSRPSVGALFARFDMAEQLLLKQVAPSTSYLVEIRAPGEAC